MEKCGFFFFLLILQLGKMQFVSFFLIVQHIGQVIDFGNLTGGFKSLLTKLKRPALKWLQNQVITKVSDLIPDNSLLAPFKNLSLTFLRNINTNAGSLKNLFTPGWLVAAVDWFSGGLVDWFVCSFMQLPVDLRTYMVLQKN